VPSDNLEDTYKALIQEALSRLRRDIKELGFLNLTKHFQILPPVDTGGRVEVLFVVGKEELECWTAWFEDVAEPELPQLSCGW
jgi:hypothetical protein